MSEGLFPAAIRHIKAAIEPEILIEAFGKQDVNPFAITNIPIETHIEREVILGQVVKDVQLFDTRESCISLEGLPTVRINDDYGTIYIPPERRGGRDIMDVSGISYGTTGFGIQMGGQIGMGSNLMASANSMLSSLSRAFPDTEHDAVLIPPNTILVNIRRRHINSGMAHVKLSVDNKLSHIKNSTTIPFIELCIYKTQQIIFTKLNIAIGTAQIERGKELGVFADRVREWRDSRQTYNDLLKEFRTTLKLNDPIWRKKHIRNMVPKLIG